MQALRRTNMQGPGEISISSKSFEQMPLGVTREVTGEDDLGNSKNLRAIIGRWMDRCMRRWEWDSSKFWALCEEILGSAQRFLAHILARLFPCLFHGLFHVFFHAFPVFWIACIFWGQVFSLDTDREKVAAKLNLASWQLHMPIGCSTILITVKGSDRFRFSCLVFLGFSFLCCEKMSGLDFGLRLDSFGTWPRMRTFAS